MIAENESKKFEKEKARLEKLLKENKLELEQIFRKDLADFIRPKENDAINYDWAVCILFKEIFSTKNSNLNSLCRHLLVNSHRIKTKT
jgi:hypothetical protein